VSGSIDGGLRRGAQPVVLAYCPVPATELPVGGVDLDDTLSALGMLPSDPTLRLRPGRLERATTTPEGTASLAVEWADGVATARADGDGAAWVLARLPGLLGLLDDPTGFTPQQRPLRDLWRRHPGDRVPRTGTLWHDLAWFVLQQRVQRADADAQWARLVHAHGTPAPGATGLLTPPDCATLARMSYAQLHPLGLERRRAQTLIGAARAVVRLQAAVDGPFAEAEPHLRAVPGIGPWTASCLATHTWGEADRVVEGDDGIPSLVSWVLAREPRADDARMLALLEPYRPHRYRVVRLAFRSGLRPPRYAPRRPAQDVRRR